MPRISPRWLSSCAVVALPLGASLAAAQDRTMVQDSTLDNLRVPSTAPVTQSDRLGAVHRVGHGPNHVVLIPGAGFGGEVFRPFADSLAAVLDATVHLITLAGFGGTPPWPLPSQGTPYAAGSWFGFATSGILRYLDSANVSTAAVVGHWIVGSQIALRLAIEHPTRFPRVALIAGVAESHFAGPDPMKDWPIAKRHAFAEAMGSRWFRTVTERTWHDNNFMPYDYAVNPLRGTLLWRRAAEPALPTWIRYLLEFYAMDVTQDLGRLTVPLTLIQPGLDDDAYFVDSARSDYMRDNLHRSWDGVDSLVKSFRRVVIPGARAFPTHDKPAETLKALREALAP